MLVRNHLHVVPCTVELGGREDDDSDIPPAATAPFTSSSALPDYRVAYDIRGVVTGTDQWYLLASYPASGHALIYYCGSSSLLGAHEEYRGAIVIARRPRDALPAEAMREFQRVLDGNGLTLNIGRDFCVNDNRPELCREA